MTYKVGDCVVCEVETTKNNNKKVIIHNGEISSEIEEANFTIIKAYFPFEGAKQKTYMILLPNDYVGWVVSQFHVKYMDVAACFLDQKFWEVTEEFILRKA